MIRAMSTAASGMDAQQNRIDVTANNLSTVNTAGFKKSRAEFQDLLYQSIRAPGTSAAQGVRVPTGLQVGQGVRTVATQKMFTQGDMAQTGNQLDIAVEGGGFFQVTMPDGTQAYTRSGNWTLDDTGRVVTPRRLPHGARHHRAPRRRQRHRRFGRHRVGAAGRPGGLQRDRTDPARLLHQPRRARERRQEPTAAPSASGNPQVGQPGLEGAAR